MAEIKLKTIGQKLVKNGALPLITSGDKKVDKVTVELDEVWQADFISKYYFVIWGNTENVYKIEMTKNDEVITADIPNEVVAFSQTISFGIYAENENGEKVLTSSVCKMFIDVGTPTDAEPVVDWQKFKKDIITALNEQFDFELSEDAENDDVVEAVYSAEISAAARTNLINAINFHFGIEISEDEDITGIIADLLTIQTAEEARAVIVTALNSHFETTIPAEATESEIVIEINGIPTYSEGYTTAKAEDAPVIAELQSEVAELAQDKPTIVTAINEHFETEIPTDLTTAETVEAIGEIPKGVETDVIFTYTEEDING